jgi:hypothetical protein
MKKFLIDEVEVSEDKFWSQVESALDEFCEVNFPEWLDGAYDEITLLGISYPFSEVLEKVDEVLYREALRDYVDSENENLKSEINEIDGYVMNGLLFRVEEVSE